MFVGGLVKVYVVTFIRVTSHAESASRSTNASEQS